MWAIYDLENNDYVKSIKYLGDKDTFIKVFTKKDSAQGGIREVAQAFKRENFAVRSVTLTEKGK